MSASDLETRTAVLETRTEYIEDRLEDQSDQLDSINTIMHSVKEHIAKQNGALPRIEEYSRRTSARLDQIELRESKAAVAGVKEHAALDKQSTITKLKTKAMVVIGSIVLGGVIGAVFTTFFNNLFGG